MMLYYTYHMLNEMAECRVRLQFTTYEALKPVDIGKDDEGHSKVRNLLALLVQKHKY